MCHRSSSKTTPDPEYFYNSQISVGCSLVASYTSVRVIVNLCPPTTPVSHSAVSHKKILFVQCSVSVSDIILV